MTRGQFLSRSIACVKGLLLWLYTLNDYFARVMGRRLLISSHEMIALVSSTHAYKYRIYLIHAGYYWVSLKYIYAADIETLYLIFFIMDWWYSDRHGQLISLGRQLMLIETCKFVSFCSPMGKFCITVSRIISCFGERLYYVSEMCSLNRPCAK